MAIKVMKEQQDKDVYLELVERPNGSVEVRDHKGKIMLVISEKGVRRIDCFYNRFIAHDECGRVRII